MKLPNHTALKEWSSVIEALGDGRQVVLVRKGGIADPAFGVEAPRFYLYPTYFHQGEMQARAEVTITHWCEVVRLWSVREVAELERVSPLVAMPLESQMTRYRFRPDQALHVIGVRSWRLPVPQRVPWREAYGGCLSWISVDEEISVDGSTSVLSEQDLEQQFTRIDALIGAQSAADASR